MKHTKETDPSICQGDFCKRNVGDGEGITVIEGKKNLRFCWRCWGKRCDQAPVVQAQPDPAGRCEAPCRLCQVPISTVTP